MACTLNPITINGGTISGTITNSCSSTVRPGKYSVYYTFTLAGTYTSVVIYMVATSFSDTYMYLLSGAGFSGSIVAQDDDSGGSYNSKITLASLAAGTYTIECTTYGNGVTGNFNLTFTGTASASAYTANVSETLTRSESLGLVTGYTRGNTESLAITEVGKGYQPFDAAASDSLSVTDGVVDALFFGVGGNELLAASESVGLLGDFQLGLTETAALTEAGAASVPFAANVSDTLAVAETESEASEILTSISETLSQTESGFFSAGSAENPIEVAGVTQTVEASWSANLVDGDSLGIGEDVQTAGGVLIVPVSEGLTTVEGVAVDFARKAELAEQVGVSESVSIVVPFFTGQVNDTTVELSLTDEVQYEGSFDPSHYELVPLDGGVPVTITEVQPSGTVKATGTKGLVLAASTLFSSYTLDLQDLVGLPEVGDYLIFGGSDLNPATRVRIEEILGPTTVRVALPFFWTDPTNGDLPWQLESAAKSFAFTVSKTTNGKVYEIRSRPLERKTTGSLAIRATFKAFSSRPRVSSVTFDPGGSVIVRFDQPMRADVALTNPAEYAIVGPTTVSILSVQLLDEQTVCLTTSGFTAGSYTLTVNATGTPKDVAGNPTDPVFNAVVFTAADPLATRSIFVDRGPIAKPPLSIQTGTGITIVNPTTITLTGASLGPTVVGLYLTLGSNTTNGGVFQITAWVSPTQVRIKSNLRVPDTAQGVTTWEVYDPRNGEIADDPIDVVVRVNGTPVTPEAVVGLQGQIVLNAAPASTDTVDVDYSFICNPTVEVRRLNSREFRLNAWNRDVGYPHTIAGHSYRYNNVLITPSNYTADDLQATLAQPLQRDLKYRAYERAYSALLNDPNLLVLNAPHHHIAYPPLERKLEASFINYLPETAPPASPWEQKGTGTAAVVFNQLVVGDTTSGPYPYGNPIYWTYPVDLTFPHVFAAAWQVQVNSVPTYEGVWTGIAAGFSNQRKAIVIGFLRVGSTLQIGILKRGFGNDPSQVAAWTGGLTSTGDPTGLPTDLDWTLLHNFRIYELNGTVRVFFDGEIVESLRALDDELPFLEELNDPFNQPQNVFFGSLSRPAVNQSTWDFFRFLIQPTNPVQTAPSIFVSYEGNDYPEDAVPPWTPIGYHGSENIVLSSSLQVDSTSATDAATEGAVGFVGGDFRGFQRLEPLLSASSDVVLDVDLQVLSCTHGVAPNAIMAAIDDGSRLLQLSFFPDRSSPKFSYGGRSYPEDFQPTPWTPTGSALVEMVGRTLRITDASPLDGRVYYRFDPAGFGSDDRIIEPASDYVFEFQCSVLSHTPDPGGFSGVMGEIYDGVRALGLMLLDVGGVRYVAPMSEGNLLPGPIQFAFEWDDGETHTYRMVKSGATISFLADGVLLGTVPYATFPGVPGPASGTVSWGSATVASVMATSVVDWKYANLWKTVPNLRHYVGFWRGYDSNSLTGYHLPLKTSGRDAVVIGNVLQDPAANFVTAGVVSGDQLVIDVGGNKGVYEIASVTPTQLTILSPVVWPLQPSRVDYRVPQQVDWTTFHKYRMMRSPDGSTTLLLDTDPVPLITIGYNEVDLPPSSAGLPRIIAGALPSITWGAFDPTNLSSSLWDYVRYGITRSPSELRIAPHHQILNQRNVMASPEHLRTALPHAHTDFWSSSTGIPPQTEPDFLKNPLLIAYTLLNEGTPLVPSTQSTDVRVPTPTTEFVSALNRPEDVLNVDGDFKLNEGETRYILHVPDDVLYTSLEVIETTTGESNLLTPFCDSCDTPDWGTFYWTKEVCLTYDGSVKPEDSGASPAWQLVSDNPSNVTVSPFAGSLTYGTTGPAQTVYRNPTSLPDSLSLTTEVTIRMKVVQDSTFGLGDSQVRLGFSSSAGFTLSLAFVTTPLGERYVLLVDQNTKAVLGGIPFDWYDGSYHTYRMVREPTSASVLVYVDS